MRLLSSSFCAVLSCVLYAGAAFAQPARASDAASAADALFQRAKEAMKRGDYDAACRDFADSQAKDPAPGTLLNLGDCEEHKRQYLLASRHFTQALDGLRKADARDPRVPYAEDRIKRLESRFASITVIMPPGAGFMGTKALYRGEEIPWNELGKPKRVDPGEVVIVVRARDRADQRIAFTLRDGESRELKIGKQGDVDGKSDKTEDRPLPRSRVAPIAFPTQTVKWVALGVGAAGFVLGATTGILALSSAGTFRDGCPDDACRDQDALDAGHRASSLATWSTIGFGVGLVGLGVGGYLLFTSPKAPPATAHSRYPTLTPVASPQGGALHLSGSF